MPYKSICSRGHKIASVGRTKTRVCRQCARDATRRWRLRNLSYLKKVAKERRLKRRNISQEQYAQLLNSQGGVCAICGEQAPVRYGERTLHIDHSHQTDTLRGLLCQKCNIGLGQFQDSLSLLRKAISYLEKWNAIEKRKVTGSN